MFFHSAEFDNPENLESHNNEDTSVRHMLEKNSISNIVIKAFFQSQNGILKSLMNEKVLLIW